MLTSGAKAQDSVSGMVMNTQGQPLRASVNTIANSKIMKMTNTDADGSFTISLDVGVSSLLIYSDDASTPGFDYLPALISVTSGKKVTATLEPAASLSLRGSILFVDTENIPSLYSYQVMDESGALFVSTGYPLSFGSKTSTIAPIPNLPAATVIVPAGVPYRLSLGVSLLVGTRMITRSFTSEVQQSLNQGAISEFDGMGPTLDYNLGLVEVALSEVSPRIIEMEMQGFYLVREKGILSRAEVSFIEAKQLYASGSYAEGFDAAKKSYLDARKTLGDLNNLFLDATSSVYIIIGFLALASVTAGFLLVDSTRLQVALGAGLYVISLLVMGVVYPGTAATPPQGFLLTSLASFTAVVVGVIFTPRLIGGGREGKVSLIGVIVPVFRIAKRSLKRRRLRFLLTLLSLTVLVMSFVGLTSLSEGYGLMIVKSSSTTPHQGLLLRASTWTDAEPAFITFVNSEVEWLSRQPGVLDVSVKVENTPQQRAITTVSGNRIYSIIGVDSKAESNILPLSTILFEGKLPGPGGVALTTSLATSIGFKLGDKVKLRDQTLTLEGLLDDFSFSSLTDLDGSRYIPDKWVNLSPPGDPPYWERQMTSASEAVIIDSSTASLFQVLGVTRIALNVTPDGQDMFAEKLALERGFKVWSASGSGVVYAALESYLEGKGLPLIIPWAIVVLNVVVTMLNSLFERRREISILSSVGLNPAEIASIFVAEASITGFIAGGLGYLAGLAFYKLMPFLGLALEVHQKVSAVWSLAAIGISISAVLVGALAALRSSIVITPSLTRKWKLDDSMGSYDKPWEVPVPVKLEPEEVDSFVGYLLERLRGLENDQVKVTSNIRVEERGMIKIVNFIYKSYQATVGNFYTKNSVIVEPKEGAFEVRLESAGNQDAAHETGSLIRLIVMEWSNRPR
jgi:ABC-type antimicrobial peptide transport system permease subunit